MAPTFDGTVVPVLSIFTEDFKIDLDAQILLTKHVLANDADVLFLCGSTGEGQYLQREKPAQRVYLLKAAENAMAEMAMKIPVIFGIYGDSADEVVEQYTEMQHAQKEFKPRIIDGFVLAPPLSVKLEDDDMEQYFSEIIPQIEEPVFLYNNPQTFGQNNIPISTYETMMQYPNFVGIKDSSGSMEYRFDILDMLERYPHIAFYSGSEGDYFKCLEKRPPEHSSKIGSVPSISNLLNLPAKIRQSYGDGDVDGARQWQEELNAIRNRIYHEPSIKGKAQRGTKYALGCLYPGSSLDREVVVIPDFVLEMTDEAKQIIKDAVDEAVSKGYLSKCEP
ncbi:MAG TPA: dihydrodipicolinate synthase family protein [Candidatus Lokiarchaeia archaeon]|nr:dihydrodipicolinate synthase family protein [Candidatus Lokiarchaeia archaeon]